MHCAPNAARSRRSSAILKILDKDKEREQVPFK